MQINMLAFQFIHLRFRFRNFGNQNGEKILFLIVMMQRRGTYVANLSIRDVNDVFEIRTALDSLACALAAERITENELESLQRLLVAIGGQIEAGDMEKIVETDTRFHDLLYQASRNTRLVGIISNLREQLTRFRSASMSFPGRLKETLEEHREIVDAIAQGDVQGAKQAERTLLMSMEAAKNAGI